MPKGARLGPAETEPGPQRILGAPDTVNLDVGPNTINIAVTAGDATTFYKIVITRGAAAADATLSELCRWRYSGVTLARVLQAHL